MYPYVIVEDDPLSAEVLRDLMSEASPAYHWQGTCGSVGEALTLLGSTDTRLVFLDMQLPDGLGFDVLGGLDEVGFDVIITTSHDGFMLEAIRRAAVDYLLKPVLRDELHQALSRFEERYAQRNDTPSRGRIALPAHDGIVLVAYQDILRLESDGAYTRFIRTEGPDIITSRNLGTYEAQFSTHGFFRVHHQFMINLGGVHKYVHEDGGHVLMSDGARIKVARRRKDAFLSLLTGSGDT